MADSLPSRQQDFNEWYNQLVLRADLADYAPVRGCMIIKPYGWALWENIQAALDRRFKATGHVNAAFPLFIPKSFLEKEKQHVEGFAPELAVVTIGGGEELAEPLIVRPTSETIIGHAYANWIKSYRDLPVLINQRNSVVRWELRTKLFLRTLEFWWQEGHTAHATYLEAEGRVKTHLVAGGVRVKLDERDGVTPGFKFNDWEMRGVPLRIEIGPRDVEKRSVVLARRDTPGKAGKSFAPEEGLTGAVTAMLESIQKAIEAGLFCRVWWSGDAGREAAIKEETKATIRCIPLEQPGGEGACIGTGRPAKQVAIFGRAY